MLLLCLPFLLSFRNVWLYDMLCVLISFHLLSQKKNCLRHLLLYYDVYRTECNIIISLTILARYIEISLHFDEFYCFSDFCQMARHSIFYDFRNFLYILPICVDNKYDL